VANVNKGEGVVNDFARRAHYRTTWRFLATSQTVTDPWKTINTLAPFVRDSFQRDVLAVRQIGWHTAVFSRRRSIFTTCARRAGSVDLLVLQRDSRKNGRKKITARLSLSLFTSANGRASLRSRSLAYVPLINRRLHRKSRIADSCT